jgi:acyl carrier protein
MTDYNDLKVQVLNIISRYAFDKDLVKNAADESRIIADLKINSARMVDIILDIEDQFEISIKDEDLDKLSTVKEIITFIQEFK